VSAPEPTGLPETPTVEHRLELMRLVSGFRVSQAVYVVARLGLADLLKDGPRAVEELASETETHAPALYRLLRFLSGVGLFSEVAPRRFALAPMGVALRSDVPGSVRAQTLNLLSEHHWTPWGDLMHSVRTGEPAFHHVYGMSTFEYFEEHPEAGALFNQAMTGNTAGAGMSIVDAYDFSGIERVVDVAGGHGQMLATVLRANPSMRGVLFDMPSVVASAAPVLAAAGVADRCDVVGGDFLAAIPEDGDAYILRQILHDWYDADAVRILERCRAAMKQSGRVLVIERAISNDYRQSLPVLHLDMEMLVTVGGIQRTDDEYRTLFADAGLRLTRIVPLNDSAQYALYEAVPA
jgi:hypothetical protein